MSNLESNKKQKLNEICHWDFLSRDLKEHILSFFDLKALLMISRVNKNLYEILSIDRRGIWKEKFFSLKSGIYVKEGLILPVDEEQKPKNLMNLEDLSKMDQKKVNWKMLCQDTQRLINLDEKYCKNKVSFLGVEGDDDLMYFSVFYRPLNLSFEEKELVKKNRIKLLGENSFILNENNYETSVEISTLINEKNILMEIEEFEMEGEKRVKEDEYKVMNGFTLTKLENIHKYFETLGSKFVSLQTAFTYNTYDTWMQFYLYIYGQTEEGIFIFLFFFLTSYSPIFPISSKRKHLWDLWYHQSQCLKIFKSRDYKSIKYKPDSSTTSIQIKTKKERKSIKAYFAFSSFFHFFFIIIFIKKKNSVMGMQLFHQMKQIDFNIFHTINQ